MSNRFRLFELFFLSTLLYAGPRAQTGDKGSLGGSLQQHYDAAQHLQQTGTLNEAAEQYRAFLGDALAELAMGYSLARDYAQSAPLFDEALALEPKSPELLLDYARSALTLGDPGHAKALVTEFIRDFPGDTQTLAQAHQVLGRALLSLNQDKDARKEFEAAVALDPTFANGYDLAVACLDLGDESCAVQVFDEMEKSFGDTAELRVAFGKAYSESDFQPRAVTEFRRAIAENPRLPRAHYLLAVVLLATGDDEEHVNAAEAELKQELMISPRDAVSYAALGKIAAAHYSYPEAEKYLRKAIALDPYNPDPQLYLGQMYFDAHRSAEAELALRECIRLTTDASRNRYQVQKAHFLLGRLLMQEDKQDAARLEMQTAREQANKTLRQDKSKLAGLMDAPGGSVASSEAAVTTGEFSAQTADSRALRDIDDLKRRLTPAIADSYNNLGAIAATARDYKTAVTYFTDAATWNALLDGLDYNWGRAAFAGSEFSNAIPPLSRYLRTHPDDNGARSVLAISEFMADRYAECIETLQPILGSRDLVPQVEYAYAESLVMTGQVLSGTERLSILEKSHPEIPEIHRALGEALNRQGERERAREELRTAVQLNPKDPEAHYDLGTVDLERDDAEGAIPELEEAVRLEPGSEKFHFQLADAYKAASRPADEEKEIRAYNALREAHAGHALNPAPVGSSGSPNN